MCWVGFSLRAGTEAEEAEVRGGNQKQERPSTPLPFELMPLQTIYAFTDLLSLHRPFIPSQTLYPFADPLSHCTGLIFTHVVLRNAVRLRRPQL